MTDPNNAVVIEDRTKVDVADAVVVDEEQNAVVDAEEDDDEAVYAGANKYKSLMIRIVTTFMLLAMGVNSYAEILPPSVFSTTTAAVEAPPPADSDPEITKALEEANQSFISQYRGRFNPAGPLGGQNCGPACLAMVLKHFGVEDAPYDSPQAAINGARAKMTGRNRRRGTWLSDMAKGAHAAGLKASVQKRMNDIDAGLLSGQVAALSGSPSTDTSYGGRLRYEHCKEGHFILIVKKIGDSYIMDDPECPDGAQVVRRDELIGYKYFHASSSAQHGAVMIGR